VIDLREAVKLEVNRQGLKKVGLLGKVSYRGAVS